MQINQLIDYVKGYAKSTDMKSDVSYIAFLISLLPIPFIQQGSQVIDRIFSDKALEEQLNELWEALSKTNERISTTEIELNKFVEIQSTVNFNSKLKSQVKALVEQIHASVNSEWVVETEESSFQHIKNSKVDTDTAQIIAKQHSVNRIENTRINATKTHLYASGNSENQIDNTEFTNKKGSLNMDKISTSGDISVNGNSVGFGVDGSLSFSEGGKILFGK